jgi:hypothetical protein
VAAATLPYPFREEPPVTRLCGPGFSSWPILPPANCQEFRRKIDWRIPRARLEFRELADSAPRCESRKRGGLVSMRRTAGSHYGGMRSACGATFSE